jgi:hypothetical protein
MRRYLDGVAAFDLHTVADDPVAWVQRLIQDERIEAVYSLLDSWDRSNQTTAALLRRGCPVPVAFADSDRRRAGLPRGQRWGDLHQCRLA